MVDVDECRVSAAGDHTTAGVTAHHLAANARWDGLAGALSGGATHVGRSVATRGLLRDATNVLGVALRCFHHLSTDLHHILEASRVGCRLDAAAVPRAGVALEGALNDGEDYELLATVRPGKLPPFATRIGVITEKDALLVHADGREEPLLARGYEHGR